ncbi:hypothetical protein DSECCO2_650320 [anaerobic digester metagenome]
MPAAQAHPFLPDAGGKAVGQDVVDMGVEFLVDHAFLFGLAHHGAGHGMGEVLLQAGGELEHGAAVEAAEGRDGRDPGPGLGQGAGLVEDAHVGRGHGFQELAALDEHAARGGLAHGGQHRKRGGELNGAGEIHQQHGRGEAGVAREGVDRRRAEKRPGDHGVGEAFGQVLRLGLVVFRLFDDGHHLLDARLPGRLFDADDDRAFLDHRAGENRVPHPFVGGQRLAGHGRLVDHGLALDHHAVHRNGAAHADQGQISGHDFRGGNAFFFAVAAHPDAVEGGGQGRGQALAGTLARGVLEHLAEPEQQGDAGRGTVVLAGDGHADGQGVEDLDVDLAARKRRRAAPQEGEHPAQQQKRPENRRQEPAQHEHPGFARKRRSGRGFSPGRGRCEHGLGLGQAFVHGAAGVAKGLPGRAQGRDRRGFRAGIGRGTVLGDGQDGHAGRAEGVMDQDAPGAWIGGNGRDAGQGGQGRGQGRRPGREGRGRGVAQAHTARDVGDDGAVAHGRRAAYADSPSEATAGASLPSRDSLTCLASARRSSMFSLARSSTAAVFSLRSMPWDSRSVMAGRMENLPLPSATAPSAPTATPASRNSPFFMESFMMLLLCTAVYGSFCPDAACVTVWRRSGRDISIDDDNRCQYQ